ncbi:glycosyltransferase [Corynebacterium alimapuense]|nr:glycosyltransferase [Corynebacterium alimapuense]
MTPLITPLPQPRVAVWRSELLRGSETFIRDQTDGLQRWVPQLIGAVRVESALTRPTDLVCYSDSWWDRGALAVAAATGVAPRVTRSLRDSGAEVIHAHFLKDAWLVARGARKLGLPLIITCHGYDVTALPARPGWRGILYRRRGRMLLRQAHSVVAVSQYIADCARALGAQDPKVFYTGIRYREIALAPKTSDVVFVGRLVDKKGVADLLAAVALAGEHLGRVIKAEIIGDGPLRDQLEAAAGPGVHFLGALDSAGVDAALARAQVFMAPSKIAEDGDAEGFGQVFLEAGLAGIPVVSYRSGGVLEAVLHEHTGLLNEPGDINGLARDLVRLLQCPELREELGNNAFQRARGELSMANRCSALESLYDSAATEVC